jgi:hypothetical protein
LEVDRGVKIAAAAGVLLLGILLAMFFRHQPAGTRQAAQGGGDELVLRKHFEGDAAAAGQHDGVPSPGTNSSDRPATVLTPTNSSTLPPEIANSATPAPQGTSQWGVSMGLMLPEGARNPPPVQIHKIVDGDTLAAIAVRYLGSADRADEIFAANRELLLSPQLLPIGAELRIPIRGDASAPSTRSSSPRDSSPGGG